MTIRVTRKIRRVLERLVKSPATATEISSDTNISFPALYPMLDRLADAGWITVGDLAYSITSAGHAGLIAVEPPVKIPEPPRPKQPYPGRMAPRPPYRGRR